MRGASSAYNEPNSHSGFGVVRHHLARLGEVGASAIDSAVLEVECARTPGLRTQLRVVDTLGPSPLPP